MDWLIWLALLIGHIGIWCFIFNRTHATAWPRFWRKLIEKAIITIVFAPIIWTAAAVWITRQSSAVEFLQENSFRLIYGAMCVTTAIWFSAAWCVRRVTYRQPSQIRYTTREVLNVESILGQSLTRGSFPRLLRFVPGNRCCWIEIVRAEISVPDEFASLRGLRIAQLSDTHLTGSIRKEYFQFVIERINQAQCDLVLVTGDLIDADSCLEWIEPIFGAIQSRLGKFFILGNHDLLISDQASYRRRLESAGLIDAAGSWHLLKLGRQGIAITGNEFPWYSGAKKLDRQPPSGFLKVLLSHSPDQIRWAISHEVDIMFAGHTHGGQIRFPIIGAVISPSSFGVRFAGGDFKFNNTLMIVSRGVSGDEPIRLNCLPQLAIWTLS